jgi:hypothetical protein
MVLTPRCRDRDPINHTRADPAATPGVSGEMDFRSRSKSQVLDDLVAKLAAVSERHPDRPRLIRMILGLRSEIDRRPSSQPAGDC